MKTPRGKFRTEKRNRKGGAALVMVLASIVFVSALMVAFLMSMRSKLLLSKSGYESNNVKMLAETAVNIAISQVRDATKKAGADSMAWASQPGMIRLYDNSGRAAGYYKLYSADNLVAESGAFNLNVEADLLRDWASAPAIFTDLNASSNGVFPILDSDSALALGVQGFSLGTVPGSTASQPAPMPVKWLYVLADGSLHTPDSSSSGTSVVIAGATTQNPVVGRIAFWTDDETCKVNVNTAAEGTFWSTPRFNTTVERAMAISQPVRGEYQRYPGHPATVSLKALFPTLTSQQIFSIAPRLSWGGSEGGTKAVQDVASWIDTDLDRLYDSMDEVLFKNSAASGPTRKMQDGLTLPMVKASRFFLTASSRAPELNLFGLPRIATWPIHAVNDANYRTTNDRLLAFCSTLGTSGSSSPFYFTREQNVDSTHDISLTRNRDLLDYLDRLTGLQIPGFGGSFQGKYTHVESRQILTEIFDYIRCTNLFDRTTPQSPSGYWPYAFGIGSRGTKGSTDHSEASSLGTAVPAYREDWGTHGFGGRFLQIRAAHIHFVGLGDANNPIDVKQVGTRGGGLDTNSDLTGKIAVQAYIYLSTLTPSEGIEIWSPGQWIEIEGLDQFGIKLNPSDGTYTKLQFPQKKEMSIMGNLLGSGAMAGARISSLEPYGFTMAKNVPKVLTTGTLSDRRREFPFFSAILPVDSSSSTMAFQGGTIKIRIYADAPSQGSGPYTRGELIQELAVKFPDAQLPTPLLATKRRIGSGDTSNPNERWCLYNNISANAAPYFEADKDVLRSVPLDKGDIRLLLGPAPEDSFFAAEEPDYSDSTKRMVPTASGVHLLRKGKLVQNAAYYQNPDSLDWVYPAPYVSDHLNGVYTVEGAPGDWDNGTSLVGDGPFINAPDPGSVTPQNNNLPTYFDYSRVTASENAKFFSPNRQMPGPGMFGSLSTGVQRHLPWQTLLFRPGPANHPGLGSPVGGPPYTKPPDHLMLDLFWMPVVEPYAISDPFSTAGKINMNQQLVPFTYINRTAGLRAALVSEKVAMVGKSSAGVYKKLASGYGAQSIDSRKALNLDDTNGTLRQFKEKFDKGEIFRSASEICDIYLVPDSNSWATDSAAQSAWYGDDFALVGDNTRERPYAHIYNKLTTKSNTFTVYYHVQILQKSKARNLSAPTVFDPGRGDKVVAEQRGAATFERYLDPADTRVVTPDPASSSAQSLEQYYRTRIVNTSVFNP